VRELLGPGAACNGLNRTRAAEVGATPASRGTAEMVTNRTRIAQPPALKITRQAVLLFRRIVRALDRCTCLPFPDADECTACELVRKLRWKLGDELGCNDKPFELSIMPPELEAISPMEVRAQERWRALEAASARNAGRSRGNAELRT
jgi:hypothetical protein